MTLPTKSYDYLGVCTQVIDGDTVEVVLDLGFYIAVTIRVRLLNVNAPELFSGPPAVRAAGALAKLALQGLLPTGTPVRVVTLKDRRSFNRYIATVYTYDDAGVGTDINALMEKAVVAILASWVAP